MKLIYPPLFGFKFPKIKAHCYRRLTTDLERLKYLAYARKERLHKSERDLDDTIGLSKYWRAKCDIAINGDPEYVERMGLNFLKYGGDAEMLHGFEELVRVVSDTVRFRDQIDREIEYIETCLKGAALQQANADAAAETSDGTISVQDYEEQIFRKELREKYLDLLAKNQKPPSEPMVAAALAISESTSKRKRGRYGISWPPV